MRESLHACVNINTNVGGLMLQTARHKNQLLVNIMGFTVTYNNCAHIHCMVCHPAPVNQLVIAGESARSSDLKDGFVFPTSFGFATFVI